MLSMLANLARGGNGGGGGGSSTPGPQGFTLSSFLLENRILECFSCKKPKGVQGRESGLSSCHPECGAPGDTTEVTANWMDLFRECSSVDCQRCREPIGLLCKTSGAFYCSPRCQIEHKKLQKKASSSGQDNAVSSSSALAAGPLQQSAAVVSGVTTGSGNDAVPPTPSATTGTAATAAQTKSVGVKLEKTLNLTVVRCDHLPSLSTIIPPPPTTKSPSVTVAVAAVASSDPKPKPKPPIADRKKKKKGRPVSSSRRTCRKCRKEFSTAGNLNKHERYFHLTTEQKEKEKKKWAFRCKLCSRRFQFKSRLERHSEGHLKATKSCEMCGKVCTTNGGMEELLSHYRNSHMTTEQKESERHCPVCSKRFNSPHGFRAHFYQMHVYKK